MYTFYTCVSSNYNNGIRFNKSIVYIINTQNTRGCLSENYIMSVLNVIGHYSLMSRYNIVR